LAIRGSTRSSDVRAMTADLNPSAYDAFAPFYDAFTAASDYERWTDQVLELAGRHGIAGGTLLDLACGTGNSFVPFMSRGFEVTACDASSAMLAEAASKAEGAELTLCDIRELPVLGSFDLITCFDDSLNYLIDEQELAAAFEGMARNLAPGGLAAFDLNSLLAYRTTFAADRVSERDGMVFAWRGGGSADAAPGCVAEARIEVFVPAGEDAYERVVTTHGQRHFPRERVLALLERAGLECVGVHGVLADASLDTRPDESRQLKVLYTATRAEGGDAW
jgi:SAM-dependent methyltransferase